MAIIGTDITKAIELLTRGKLVAIPTETVYGLAGNALNEEAILDIFGAKNRPQFNPLIAHVDSLGKASQFVTEIPPIAVRLAKAFWPGPLTILLSRNRRIPDLLTAGSPLVAIRIPNHPLTLKLLQQLPFPLAAPSANPSGYISPTSAAHVQAQLGDKIPYILDGGRCKVGIESTIIGVNEDNEVLIYRLGGTSLEAIRSLVGDVQFAQATHEKPDSPGMLKSHYAPQTPFRIGIVEEMLPTYDREKVGILHFSQSFSAVPSKQQRQLSPSGDLREAAQSLFSAMRELDGLGLSIILAEYVPAEGLGLAINDRLTRAAYQE